MHIHAREDFLDLLIERNDVFIEAVANYLKCFLNCLSSSHSLMDLSNKNHRNELFFKNFDNDFKLHNFVPHLDHSRFYNKSRYYFTPPRGIKETQLNWIHNQLSKDWRYCRMGFLTSERQTLITTRFDLLLPVLFYQYEKQTAGSNLINYFKSLYIFLCIYHIL